MTLNDHPHAGIHSHEEIYDKLAAVLNHDTSSKLPIQFDVTNPEFLHAFFNVVHRDLETKGCDFWWPDWQQGPFSRIPGIDPLWVINHFHYLDHQKHTSETDALIFSRYAGPGSHRYPIGFSGDSFCTWASLEFQAEFTATASNIGYGWWSHDIGGHMAGYRDDEMTTRWIQLGVFSPIFRLHSNNIQWSSKEPWKYRAQYRDAMCEFMRLRHRLVPYIYSVMRDPVRASLPLVQPLYWNFPSTEVAYQYPNEYFFGDHLLVLPITKPINSTTNHAHVQGWVPPGRHLDIMTGIIYDGDREIDLYRPLEKLPALTREGSIIPLDGSPVPANGCSNPESLKLLVIVGRDGEFTILENGQDDAQPKSASSRREICIKWKQSEGKLETISAGKNWTFTFISLSLDPSNIQVLVDGESISTARTTVESFGHSISTKVTLPMIPNDTSLISVQLSHDPEPKPIDFTEVIREMILDFQIDMHMKDKIWKAVSCRRPVSITIGELLRLGLEKDIIGPIIELLISDSRSSKTGCCCEKN